MESAHETEPATASDETPLPMRVDQIGSAVASAPAEFVATSTALLALLRQSNGAWFPSQFAKESGVPRESLDAPLAELRIAGLILATEWVRGQGQGFTLTERGKLAANNAAGVQPPKLAVTAIEPNSDELIAVTKTETDTTTTATTDDSLVEDDLKLDPPVVVPLLLTANAIWFFVCAVWSIRWGLTLSRSLNEGHPEVLLRFGAVRGEDLLEGDWWRLLTACFVHVGAIHLIANMFALAMMGPLAELLWGRLRLLVIYMLSGLAGSALAMTLHPNSLLAGASGAIWGVQMSLFAWLFAYRKQLPADVAADWFRRLSVVFLLNAAVSFLPGISWEGHLGGGIAGLLTAGLLNAARFGDRSRRTSAVLLLLLLPFLFVGGLAAAMDAKGMPGWVELRQRLQAQREARDNANQTRKILEASTIYDARVTPRLPELSPPALGKLTIEVGEFLLRTQRSQDRAKILRTRLQALKATAEDIKNATEGEPLSAEPLDTQRALAHRFASARSRSFDLLLAMLELHSTAPREMWVEWQLTQLEAEAVWGELKRLEPKR